MPSAGSLASTLALCFGSAAGHMIMQHPVPYGKDSLNNSPLNDAAPGTSQSDFPCKQRSGVYQVGTMNDIAVAQPVGLNFTGSASHGGGTCQISVSLDQEPTAKSVFKVVKSFEGGCPIDGDSSSGGSSSYQFQLPDGFPNGRASLAWTWYNRIGNREIYMNCAPIMVSGGADNNDVYDSLPNMYVINLPTSECKSADSEDVQIPNGGVGPVNQKSAAAKLAPPTGPGCAAAAKAVTANMKSSGAGSSAGSSSSSAPTATSDNKSQTAVPASSNTESASTPASSDPASSSGFATVTTIASSAAASEPATSAPAADSSSSFPTMSVSSDAGVSGPASTGFAASPSGTTSSGSGSSSGTCSTNGALLCNGSTQFGLCNNGKVVWQSVASGTVCSNGQIQKRSESRHAAHVRRHATKNF